MKKLVTHRQKLQLDKGEKELVYSILVLETGDSEEVPTLEHYGIGVEAGDESRRIPAITPNADKIRWLCDYLAERTVTPVSIDDVMSDLLGTAL